MGEGWLQAYLLLAGGNVGRKTVLQEHVILGGESSTRAHDVDDGLPPR